MFEPITYLPAVSPLTSFSTPSSSSFPAPYISSRDLATSFPSTKELTSLSDNLPNNLQMFYPRCSAVLSLPFNQSIIDSFVSSFKSWDRQQQMSTLLNLVFSMKPEQLNVFKEILNGKTDKMKKNERHSYPEQIPDSAVSQKQPGHKQLTRTLSLLPQSRKQKLPSPAEGEKFTENIDAHTIENLNAGIAPTNQLETNHKAEFNDENRTEKTMCHDLTPSHVNTVQNNKQNEHSNKNIFKNNSLDYIHKHVDTQSSYSSFDGNPSKEENMGVWAASMSFWFKHLRLHKYYTPLQHLSYHQLFSLSQQNLVDLGLTVGASDRLLLNIKTLNKRNEKVDCIAKELEGSSFNTSRIISDLSSILKCPFITSSSEEDAKERCDYELIQKILEASIKISDALASAEDKGIVDLFNGLITIAIKNPSIPQSYTDSFRSLRQQNNDITYFNQKMQLKKSFSYNYSRINKQSNCNSQPFAHQQLARRKTTTSLKPTFSDYFQERLNSHQENKKNLQKHLQIPSIKIQQDDTNHQLLNRQFSVHQTFIHEDAKNNMRNCAKKINKNTNELNKLNKQSISENIWQNSKKNDESLKEKVNKNMKHENNNDNWQGNIDDKHHSKNNQKKEEISNNIYNKIQHRNNYLNNENNSKNDEAPIHKSEAEHQHTKVDKMLSVPANFSLKQH